MTSKPLTKKNLLLCLDAFGTLFTPSIPIPIAYARAAARHGIHIPNTEDPTEVGKRFKEAFKKESQQNPNYGKATGMGAEKWWGNIIHATFTPFLQPGQPFPQALTKDLIHHFSSSAGYTLYPDVQPFFAMLRSAKTHQTHPHPHPQVSPPENACTWPWEKTIVGIITNSDSRVPSIIQSFGGLSIAARRFDTPSPPLSSPTSSSFSSDISFTTLSYDVGHSKPSPPIFRAAEEMLKWMLHEQQASSHGEMDSYEKLHVGDDVEKDYYGAEKAGWGRVLLQRDPAVDGEKEWEGIRLVHKEGKGKGNVDVARSLMDLRYWRP